MILESLKRGSNSPQKGSVTFFSTKHTRIEGGFKHPESICKRNIQIESNVSNSHGYTVTILNGEGNHPLWGANVQMSAKPMEIISIDENRVELRGYGYDKNAVAMGKSAASFRDYGLEIVFSINGEIQECTLVLYDRGIRIVYS